MLQVIQNVFKNDSGFSWKNQLRLHSYFGNSLTLPAESTPTSVQWYTTGLHWIIHYPVYQGNTDPWHQSHK